MSRMFPRRLAGRFVALRATVAIVTFGSMIDAGYADPIGPALYDELNNEAALVCPSLEEHAAKQPLAGRFDCKQPPPPVLERAPYEARPSDGAKRTSSPEQGAFGTRRPPPMHAWP